MVSENVSETKRDGKLVAYFSWSGNAKAVGEQIAQETGGDLFEIRTVQDYPDNYDECRAAARIELRKKARPRLVVTENDVDVQAYDTIFLCYPNWLRTMPMAVFTFLESYDTAGKTIYPVVTHGGSKFGKSLRAIKKLCRNAVIGKWHDVSISSKTPRGSASDNDAVGTPNRDVTAWLNAIGKGK
ncbi:MAG: hypothetical protein LBL41_00925 [Bifidobacteriaceae bacterium]|jgi:flavodoxin|nr:hypothetical protein [Bifidobacteriaceae bacterium]